MGISKNLNYQKTSFLDKANSGFIESMYLKFVENDPSLPESWKQYFSGLDENTDDVLKEISGPSWGKEKSINKNNNKKDLDTNNIDSVKAIALIRAYRIRGHLIAKLDPLELMNRDYVHELHPSDHGFEKEDYKRKIYLDNYMDLGYANISEILSKLRRIYCSTIGAQYMHISDPKEKVWIRERFEKDENKINFTKNGKKAILNKIIQAEGFEKFLATKYVGTKRFGLDGAESLIPALEQIIKRGGQLGVKEVKIGMSHRGRLNVLANVCLLYTSPSPRDS